MSTIPPPDVLADWIQPFSTFSQIHVLVLKTLRDAIWAVHEPIGAGPPHGELTEGDAGARF